MKSNNALQGKRIAAIIGIVVASLLVIVAFCGRYFNSGFKQFANFFLGSFGMSFYGLMAVVIVVCSFSLAGKSVKIPAKYVVHFVLMFVALSLFVHILTTTYLPKDNFATYVKYVYHYYDDGFGVPTFGGVVFGLLAYPLERIITIWGALIIVVALLVWNVFVVGDFFYSYFTGKLMLRSNSTNSDIEPSAETSAAQEVATDDIDEERQKAIQFLFQESATHPEEVSTQPSDGRFGVSPQSSLDSSPFDRSQAEDILFGNNTSTQQGNGFFPVSSAEQEPEQESDEFIVRGYYNQSEQTAKPQQAEPAPSEWKISSPVEQTAQEPTQPKQEITPPQAKPTEQYKSYEPVVEQPAAKQTVDVVDVTINDEPNVPYDEPFVQDEFDLADEDEDVIEEPVMQEPEESEDEVVAIPKEIPIETSSGKAVQTGFDFMTRGQLQQEQTRVHKFVPYEKPPFELLDDVTIMDDFESEDRQRIAEAIVNKLAVFRIDVEVAKIIVGPSVTRYMFNVLSPKTRMSEFKQYSDDIKACVEAQEDIRIEAPVHGTNQVGIEVANKVKSPVVLRSLLESRTFQDAKGKLVFAIGKEITGKVIVADLADMPHLLIAGTTGSGKSVCLNCLIVSLIYKYGPEYVRFVMVDPKFVELSRYNGIPHMLTSETITNVTDALAGLDYLINEMDARYQLFRQNSVGNISEYNSRVNTNVTQKLPYMVFVVDELADLMSASKQAFEQKLGRLAQKSRAAGIHIVLATQRPDVKVITGTIKANLPCRMALKVASQFDSGTIINSGGAEKLLGRGDMLFMNPGSPDLERIQGAYISNDEIRNLVEFSKAKNEVFFDEKVSDEIFISRKQAEAEALEQEASKDPANKESQLDPYCKKALRFWLEKQGGRASIASIQRNLGIGFNRAGRIMDSLQKMKYVEELSPSDPSSKPLKVLVTVEELDDLFPDMQD